MFLLAPFGRSLVFQVVLWWGCSQNRTKYARNTSLRLKNKRFRSCPACVRVNLQGGCLLSKTEGRGSFILAIWAPQMSIWTIRKRCSGGGTFSHFLPEAVIYIWLYFWQFWSLNHRKLPKFLLLAPFVRSAVSQVAL